MKTGVDLIWAPYGFPTPETEYRFHQTRRWRFDFAWVSWQVAVEVNGGIWIKGRSGRGGAHSLPSNIIRDMEKNNEATRLGWRVFEFTPRQLKTGEAQAFMKQVIR